MKKTFRRKKHFLFEELDINTEAGRYTLLYRKNKLNAVATTLEGAAKVISDEDKKSALLQQAKRLREMEHDIDTILNTNRLDTDSDGDNDELNRQEDDSNNEDDKNDPLSDNNRDGDDSDKDSKENPKSKNKSNSKSKSKSNSKSKNDDFDEDGDDSDEDEDDSEENSKSSASQQKQKSELEILLNDIRQLRGQSRRGALDAISPQDTLQEKFYLSEGKTHIISLSDEDFENLINDA